MDLTRGEKLAALRKRDVVIPWAGIRRVEAVAEPIRLVHGLRAPGLGIPGRTKIGTWRSKGRKTFAVTHKAAAGLRITLQNNTFDEILLSVPDPVLLADQISSRLIRRPAPRLTRPSGWWPSALTGITIAGTFALPSPGHDVHAAPY